MRRLRDLEVIVPGRSQSFQVPIHSSGRLMLDFLHIDRFLVAALSLPSDQLTVVLHYLLRLVTSQKFDLTQPELLPDFLTRG